jgi:hypothetical protein
VTVWIKASAINAEVDQKAEVLDVQEGTDIVIVKLLGTNQFTGVRANAICGLFFNETLSIIFNVRRVQKRSS